MEPRDYGPFPYVPINQRPVLKWPNGARLAVWIIPNIEFFPLTQGIPGSVYSSHAPVPSTSSQATAQSAGISASARIRRRPSIQCESGS